MTFTPLWPFIGRLPSSVHITEIDMVGYSLGNAERRHSEVTWMTLGSA